MNIVSFIIMHTKIATQCASAIAKGIFKVTSLHWARESECTSVQELFLALNYDDGKGDADYVFLNRLSASQALSMTIFLCMATSSFKVDRTLHATMKHANEEYWLRADHDPARHTCKR